MKTQMKVQKIITEIALTYNAQQYQRISKDIMFDNVPNELRILWYSDGSGRMSISNVGHYFDLFKREEISDIEMIKMLADLKDALAQEFELIHKANIKKGERRYEGIIKFFTLRLGSFLER